MSPLARTSDGRRICDECSDAIELTDDRDQLAGRIVHADWARQARRPLRAVS